MTKGWGATEEEWAQLKKLAKVDLLPVVSNPEAVPSKFTRIKTPGKTPSLLIDTQDGKRFIGYSEWTDVRATVPLIEAWKKEPDHGICVQTRRVRAVDIDLSDVQASDRALAILAKGLGVRVEDLPIRGRANSSRCLVAFVCQDDDTGDRAVLKRGSFKAESGLVEFLGTGQQFIAAGTHKSGERYEWRGGLPASWQVFDWEDVKDAIWAIYEELGVDGTWRGFGDKLNPGLYEGELDVDDPVAEHLVHSQWPAFYTEGNNFFIECPWKDGHSSESGETETAWLMAGTANYRNGHFKCLHASCAGRKDQEFFDAVGYRLVKAEEFEDLTKDDPLVGAYTQLVPATSPKAKELKAAKERGPELPLPGLLRDGNGGILACIENTRRMLKRPDIVGGEIARDLFRGELMFAERSGEWRSLEEADTIELRITMEDEGFKAPCTKEMMRDALEIVGRDRQFDSAIEWLTNTVPAWDGEERVKHLFPFYLKTADTPYTRAVGEYAMTAHAGRILHPGVQADMVPVLVGDEGLRKTSALKALVPSLDFYGEFRMDAKDDDLARLMRGKLLGELAELRGISVRDGDAVLAWVTRTFEEWTPKFKEYAAKLMRRLVFYGTTNDPDFLQSRMGLRRWLPVTVLGLIDTDMIEADRLQIWAEARELYLKHGVMHAEAERLAKREHASYRSVDAWHDVVARGIDQPIDVDGGVTWRKSGRLTVEDVLIEILGMDRNKIEKRHQMRVTTILKSLGLYRDLRRVKGKPMRVWLENVTTS